MPSSPSLPRACRQQCEARTAEGPCKAEDCGCDPMVPMGELGEHPMVVTVMLMGVVVVVAVASVTVLEVAPVSHPVSRSRAEA